MDNLARKNSAVSFAGEFASALGKSLESMTESTWPFEILSAPDSASQKGNVLHFRLTVDGALSGECFVEFYEPQVVAILSKILKEPVTELTEEHSEVLAKVIRSATDSLATSLADSYGKVDFKIDCVAGLAFGGMLMVPFAVAQSTGDTLVNLYFGAQLLDALSARERGQGADAGSDEVIYPYNLRLVMDVELNVSLRFGQRKMQLREVLNLNSGSVIELDRMVDEPVELYLDGKLIARGEAVVVDGNYGLRVTEIPQPVATHFLN